MPHPRQRRDDSTGLRYTIHTLVGCRVLAANHVFSSAILDGLLARSRQGCGDAPKPKSITSAASIRTYLGELEGIEPHGAAQRLQALQERYRPSTSLSRTNSGRLTVARQRRRMNGLGRSLHVRGKGCAHDHDRSARRDPSSSFSLVRTQARERGSACPGRPTHTPPSDSISNSNVSERRTCSARFAPGIRQRAGASPTPWLHVLPIPRPSS